ncbi:MAG: hypothetical protein KDA92_25270 [Planctomycetales bacterium]|nr:hypothetical protein [Planctomycetales bacterium]
MTLIALASPGLCRASIATSVSVFNVPSPQLNGWQFTFGDAYIDLGGLHIINSGHNDNEGGYDADRLQLQLAQGRGNVELQVTFTKLQLNTTTGGQSLFEVGLGQTSDVYAQTQFVGLFSPHEEQMLELHVVTKDGSSVTGDRVKASNGSPSQLTIFYNSNDGFVSAAYDDDLADTEPPLTTLTRNLPHDETLGEQVFFALVGFVELGSSQEITISSVVVAGTHALGDFSDDGTMGVDDIDTLQSLIRLEHAKADVNDDQQVDIADLTYWLHDLAHSYFGDANLDGEFNSADLIGAFQAGEYEDDAAGNSTWSTGDWNGDREFTTADLVVAFQDGGYELSSQLPVASVPEPQGWNFLVTGVLASCANLRRREITVRI